MNYSSHPEILFIFANTKYLGNIFHTKHYSYFEAKVNREEVHFLAQ